MIKEKLNRLIERDTVPTFCIDIKENTDSNVLKAKKIKKHKYYICDYCNEKIDLEPKQEERNGGKVMFPNSLTKKREYRTSIMQQMFK